MVYPGSMSTQSRVTPLRARWKGKTSDTVDSKRWPQHGAPNPDPDANLNTTHSRALNLTLHPTPELSCVHAWAHPLNLGRP